MNNASDTITEVANEGIDAVESSVTYTLVANVETLTLTGTSAINGTGNTLNNVITGNSGANVLNGGAGIDSMVGGAGNDIVVRATIYMLSEPVIRSPNRPVGTGYGPEF